MQRCEETAQTEERKEIAEVRRRKSEKKTSQLVASPVTLLVYFIFPQLFFIFDE